MKPVLQLLAASALAVGMTIGGVVLASSALSPEEDPHRFTGLDIKDLWTSEPVRVDPDQQTLDRLPPRYASHVVISEPQQNTAQKQAETVERTTRSRIAEVPILADAPKMGEAENETAVNALPPEHFAWCSERYRSYEPMSNTYRSFSGESRSCASPFQTDVGVQTEEAGAELVTVSGGDMEATPYALDEEHVMACMQRYRSYRPTDNTYQPYGGGPRQTCGSAAF